MKTFWNVYTKIIIGVFVFGLFAAGGVNYYTKVQSDAKYLNKADTVSFSDIAYTKAQTQAKLDSLLPTPYATKIVEQKARIASQNITYAGTVRNVTTGAAALITAYNASTNGDVIQCANGTYELSSETGGYLLLNTAGKGVVFKGNANDNTAVVFNHSTATYGVRMRDCGSITFENITFTSNQNYANGIVQMESGYSTNYVKFKNCRLINTNTGASARIFNRLSLTGNTDATWIEFENCTITNYGAANPISYSTSGANETILIKGCVVTAYGSRCFGFDSTHKGKCVLYDNTLIQNSSNNGIELGENTAVPTNSTYVADIRNNTITLTGSNYGDGIIAGRGTTKIYCVNNTITAPAVVVSYGLIVKSIGGTLGDAYYAGNRITAAYPIYVKGGKNSILKYNTSINNLTGYAGLGVINPAADLLSSTNVIQFNNFIGIDAAIKTSPSSSWEQPATTMQGWTFGFNNYYSTSGVWLKDDVTDYTFANKKNFWGSSYNDTYSRLLPSSYINYDNETFVFDNTTVN